MTSKDSSKKRCVIKKLDFENCIVTGIKTRARGKRKLRARVTHEIETFSGSPKKKIKSCPSPDRSSSRETSPVLTRKQTEGSTSPVLLREKRIDLNKVQDLPHCSISSEKSPVFKLKTSKFGDFSQSQHSRLILERTSSGDMFFVDGNSKVSCARNFSKTQESQESVTSVHISSVESMEVKVKSLGNYSVEVKSDSFPTVLETSEDNSKSDIKEKVPEGCEESEEVWPALKKNYRRKSLLGRLQKALKRKASEKLLWQHQRQRNVAFDSQKLAVINFWNQESIYFLKSETLVEEPEMTYIIIDSKWVPNVKRVKEGSIVQLHPPWHKLSVKGNSVILNVICMEILDEVSELQEQKVLFDSVPTSPYDTDQSLLINSLFSTCDSGYLF